MKLILNTERLYLREFTIDDAQNFIDLNSDPKVIKYTGDSAIETLEKAKEILTTITFPQYENKLGRWAVHLKSNGEFLGWCGLKYIKELDEIDLGYRFFEKHWGKGYATESGKAVLDHGFNTLKLKTIIAEVAIENKNSLKVLEKLGMTRVKEGVGRCGEIFKYSLTNTEYQSII